jgi:hypothetical protein
MQFDQLVTFSGSGQIIQQYRPFTGVASQNPTRKPLGSRKSHLAMGAHVGVTASNGVQICCATANWLEQK